MKFDRTKNASQNVVTGIFNRIISVVLPFICRTVFIQILGKEYLGLNGLFTSLLQVLSVVELGFGNALVFSMYKPIAEDDDETVCALLNLYKKTYHVIGLIVLIIGLLLIPFVPKLVAGQAYPADINIYVVYGIYVANTVASYFFLAYKSSLLIACQRSDIINNISTALNLCSNIGQIVILVVSRNYYWYILLIPVLTILTNLINAFFADRMFPQYKCYGRVEPSTLQDIKKRVCGLFSYKIYGVIFSSVDTIVISAFLGLGILAVYTNYNYIVTAVTGFISIFTSSILAGIGNSIVTENVEKNYRDFMKLTFINGWIVSWCSICMLCLFQHFMYTWVGEEFLFPTETMCLMVLYFLLPRITTMTAVYREACGLWWEDRIRPIIATIVNLAVNIILVKTIGINGVIISTLLCTVFINVPWGTHIIFKKYFLCSPWSYFRSIITYILTTVLVGIVTYMICSILPEKGWGYLFLKAIICIVIPNILLYLLYRKRVECKESVSLIKRMLQHKLKK